MPGGKEKSVHLTDFPALGPQLSPADEASWERVFRLREKVNQVLERARAGQQIGQSLEADVELHAPEGAAKAVVGNLDIDLADVFIVSHVDWKPPTDEITDAVEIEGVGRIAVGMKPARGNKCGRCWKYREEVAEAGQLCNRCDDVIIGLAPEDVPTA